MITLTVILLANNRGECQAAEAGVSSPPSLWPALGVAVHVRSDHVHRKEDLLELLLKVILYLVIHSVVVFDDSLMS